MPTFRANVQYLIGLNNSRKTSVNVHRNTANNRPNIPSWSISPNVYAGTGYGPNDLDPPVGNYVPPPSPPVANVLLLDFGINSNEKILVEESIGLPGFEEVPKRFYIQEEGPPYQKYLVDQHYGIFIQTDFHTPITKTVTANNAAEARALFIATYGVNSLIDEPQQI